MAKVTRTSIEINIDDLDKDDLRSYIQANNFPANVFSVAELDDWAKENGYTKEH